MLTIKTKYHGININVEYDRKRKVNDYYLTEDGNGADDHFDHLPTDAEVDEFRDEVSEYEMACYRMELEREE